MTSATDISPELCQQLLQYDPETGKLYWLPRADARKCWNSRYAGKEAFTATDRHGYRVGKIHDVALLAHRVAFAVWSGTWPAHELDHINGNRSDNRIANLRDVSATVNRRNTARHPRNTSGTTGVYWNKATRRWRAYAGRAIYLGTFNAKEDAIAARRAFSEANGFTERHGT